MNSHEFKTQLRSMVVITYLNHLIWTFISTLCGNQPRRTNGLLKKAWMSSPALTQNTLPFHTLAKGSPNLIWTLSLVNLLGCNYLTLMSPVMILMLSHSPKQLEAKSKGNVNPRKKWAQCSSTPLVDAHCPSKTKLKSIHFTVWKVWIRHTWWLPIDRPRRLWITMLQDPLLAHLNWINQCFWLNQWRSKNNKVKWGAALCHPKMELIISPQLLKKNYHQNKVFKLM